MNFVLLVAFTFALLQCVQCAPKKLELGLPTVVTIKDDKNLCPFQVELPANLGAIQILVDIAANSALTAGQQSALIYAAPGTTITRSAEYRYHKGEAGDVRCTILNPKAGIWTIGLLAQCPDAVCFGVLGSVGSNNYDVRVSVIPLDQLMRPQLVLQNGRKTGYLALPENTWAFFSFRLTSPSKVWFKPNKYTQSTLDVLHVVAHQVTNADLASGNGGLPTDVDQGFGNEIKDVDFAAGTWVVGVWATSNKVGASLFDVTFGYGAEPKGDQTFYPDRMPVDYCPDVDAPAEVGTWDECTSLLCGDCLSSYGKGKSCIWCNGLTGGRCSRSTSCGVTGKQVTDVTMCNLCKDKPCDSCTGTSGCSYCSLGFFNSKSCIVGTQCATPDADLSSMCMAKTAEGVQITKLTDAPVTSRVVATIGTNAIVSDNKTNDVPLSAATATIAAVAAAAAAIL